MTTERDELARTICSADEATLDDERRLPEHPNGDIFAPNWERYRPLADAILAAGYRKVTTDKDAEAEYWTAGRDGHGNIRLRNGKGRLLAHAAATRDEVQLWHERAANSQRRAHYAAALELFDREAAGGNR